MSDNNEYFKSSQELHVDALYELLEKTSKNKTLKPIEKVKKLTWIFSEISKALKSMPKA